MRAWMLPALAAAALAGCGDPCDGRVCTWAGTGEAAFNGDGHPAAGTAFYWPVDVSFGPDGRPYVLDWNNHRVRRVEADGTVVTVMGTPTIGDGPDEGDERAGVAATRVNLNHPTALAFLPDGGAVLAAWHNHKLRRFDPASGRAWLWSGAGPGFAGDGAAVEGALWNQPKALAVARDGTLYVVDQRNQRVRRISPGGTVVSVVGTGERGFSGDGAAASGASVAWPTGGNPLPGGALALDEARGVLYVADTDNHRVRAVTLATGRIDTVVGSGAQGPSVERVAALEATLDGPRDLALDAAGRLYVADTENHAIRRYDPETGVLERVAGTGVRGFAGDGDAPARMQLARPFGVSLAPDGSLYVADTYNHRIRRVPAEALR